MKLIIYDLNNNIVDRIDGKRPIAKSIEEAKKKYPPRKIYSIINFKMKSYTDLEQSKRLAEILPLESADMYWWSSGGRHYIEAMNDGDFNEKEGHLRAWSIAALSEFILPYIVDDNGNNYKFYLSKDSLDRWIAYYKSDDISIHICEESDNMIDVILEMVCWLLKAENIFDYEKLHRFRTKQEVG